MHSDKSLFRTLYRAKARMGDFWFFGWHRQLLFYLKYRLSKTRLKIVLIYCQGRTGSTFLSSALGQHSQCVYEEEVLRRKVWHWKSFLSGLGSRHPDKWYVLKVKPMHLLRHAIDLDDLMEWAQLQQVVLVHLRRDDHFKHALSKIIAAERNEYIRKVKGGKVHVERGYLQEKIKELQGFSQVEKEQLKPYSAIKLSYERSLASEKTQWNTLKHLMALLNIEEEKHAFKVYKVLNKSLSKEVLNWEELSDLQKEPEPSGEGPGA